MSNATIVSRMIEESDVKYVDFRFTDIKGQWHHISYQRPSLDEATLANGIAFDGSSIVGWRDVHKSDMLLKPDLDLALASSPTLMTDPFSAQPQAVLFCDIFDPDTALPYTRCPRSIAKRAVGVLRQSGIADTVYVGPEAEFFVFDNVRFEVSANRAFYEFESEEGPCTPGQQRGDGQCGHRPSAKGGYMPTAPIDSGGDMRAEMLSTLSEMGVPMEKHHHEVAPSQHELGQRYSDLLQTADWLQVYKYVVRMVAHSYGKSATFMPKPLVGDNGSGMHVHMSLWKDGRPLFAGDDSAGLSEIALHYIGGVLKHARALNAFANPSTNSYKRLVPGFEAPVALAYSATNRSAACRIPHAWGAQDKRVEFRFPDPSANPYLTFASIMMAGLDGIENKITPGDSKDHNLYELSACELKKTPTVAASLDEALQALDADRTFLKRGDVFTDDMIDSYIELKSHEVRTYARATHPIEYQMYYSS